MSEDRWYFAYGSNLCIDRKERRTGRIRSARPCRLEGYRLAFDKRDNKGTVFANIVADSSETVLGVVYLCCPVAIKELDRYEGVSGGHYEHHSVEVITHDGDRISALTYVAGADHVCEEGKPSAEYLGHIISGAIYHGLSQEYILNVERLAMSCES